MRYPNGVPPPPRAQGERFNLESLFFAIAWEGFHAQVNANIRGRGVSRRQLWANPFAHRRINEVKNGGI